MKTPETEMLDLALAQAIERYMAMEPNEAHDAIEDEWPEQIVVLLAEFFFKTACPDCGAGFDFIPIERENGNGAYLTPICACEINPRLGGEP